MHMHTIATKVEPVYSSLGILTRTFQLLPHAMMADKHLSLPSGAARD